MKKAYTTVLTIAGSDGSGGAGIQADIKTFAALECYGLSVITALTAQNTMGVSAVYPLAQTCVIDQFRAISADISIDAVKIGMLGSAAIIKTVSSLLRELKHKPPVILDTALSSSGGTPFFPQEAIPLMIAELFPLVTLITPNLPETALLTGMRQPLETQQEIESAALQLHKTGAASVLVKGGHGGSNECRDCLFFENRFFWFSSKKIITSNSHGTGCTLSSAIAAFMAKGETTENAVKKAKEYLEEALKAGSPYRLGKGNGPLHHLYRLWK
jgi:hydroxymethylpyrimidine/phosphomethylpyrimidine kinase